MTILPKKKPVPAPDGDADSGPDAGPERGADSGPERGPGGVGDPGGPGVGGPRPRASPPPPLRGWAGLPGAAGSPPPAGPGGPGSGGPGSADGPAALLGLEAAALGLPEPRGPGCGGGGGGGPGHSKRRRRGGAGPSGGPAGSGPGGIGLGMGLGPGCGSPGPDEAGGGYNSEDEYEAGRVERPATAEQQEHRFEKALREKKGFIIKRMKEDGACLFRAVADQVYGDQDMHEVVRKHCMDYLMKNADYFSNYVTEDFTTYINRKRKSTCHGNHIEMQAMAEMYNRPVEVYQYGTEPINTFHGIQHNEDEPIRVSYHRNIHYNSVVNPNKATIAGAGLPSFKPGLAEQSLMKSAIKTSEESWIEQQMLEDKKRATDWEATNEAIEEQVARESYLQWLRDQEKQARQPRKASATCSSATAAAASGLEEWSGRSPRPRSAAPSPEHPGLHPEPPGPKPPSPGAPPAGKPPSPCAPGTSSQLGAGGGRATPPLVSLYPALECRAIMQQIPTAFGLNDWEDDEILASVLAVSQQEYLETMKTSRHRDPAADKS
ncbi:LOW QUALITY PROTEIN: OTU domain-containing protein 5 [Sylvia borin]